MNAEINIEETKFVNLLTNKEFESCILTSPLLLLSGRPIPQSTNDAIFVRNITSKFHRSESNLGYGFYKPISKF